MKSSELLIKAKALIADPKHWTQGRYAQDAKGQTSAPCAPDSVCWCSLGAIEKVAYEEGTYSTRFAAGRYLSRVADEYGCIRIPEFNDNSSHETVMEAWDRAIKHAKEDEKMKIANLSEEQLNYLVAKSLNWQWRYPWLLADEGYVSWRSAEDAWGNWHPEYCSSWAAIGPIMTTYGIFPEVNDIRREDNGYVTFDGGFFAKTPAQVLDGLEGGEWGSTPQIAVVRAYLVQTYGKEVDMPELETIP